MPYDLTKDVQNMKTNFFNSYFHKYFNYVAFAIVFFKLLTDAVSINSIVCWLVLLVFITWMYKIC